MICPQLHRLLDNNLQLHSNRRLELTYGAIETAAQRLN